MAAPNMPSIWSTMQYAAPRGPCNYRQSFMSPKCPCLRFMLHPLKSSSSYECDGCQHHASFHSMENKQEDDVRKRWEQEAREKQKDEEGLAARPKKRLRAIEYGSGRAGAAQTRALEDSMPISEGDASATGGKAAGRGKGKKSTPGPTTRTKGRVADVEMDVGEEYIELD